MASIVKLDIENSNAHVDGSLDVVAFRKCIDPELELTVDAIYSTFEKKYINGVFSICGYPIVSIFDDNVGIYSYSSFKGVDVYRCLSERIFTTIFDEEHHIVRYKGENYLVNNKRRAFKIDGIHICKAKNIYAGLYKTLVTNNYDSREIWARTIKLLRDPREYTKDQIDKAQKRSESENESADKKFPKGKRKFEW